MAQEPKRRHSKARKRTRRASIFIKQLTTVTCTNCQKPTLPHQMCLECGFYKSKQVRQRTQTVVTKA